MFRRYLGNLNRLKRGLKLLRIDPAHLLFPSLLALLAAIAEGAAFGLLIPVLRGLVYWDFTMLKNLPVLKDVFEVFPSIFKSSQMVFILSILLIYIFILLKTCLNYLSFYLTAGQVRKVGAELRRVIFSCYLQFNKAFFDCNNSGYLHHVLIGYTEQIATQFRVLSGAAFGFFSLIIYFVIMCWISWELTFVIAIIFPVIIFIFQKILKKIRSYSYLFSAEYNILGKKISNVLHCIPLIKATASSGQQMRWFEKINQNIKSTQNQMDKFQLLVPPINENLVMLLIIIIMCVIAFIVSQDDQRDFSKFFVFFLLMRRSMNSGNSIGSVIASLASIRGPLRDILKIYSSRKTHLETTGDIKFERLKQGIQFESLCFRYKDQVVFKNLNLFFEKGKVTAIVGKTGAGKSTIASLIMRFYEPFQGKIKVDGVDLRSYDLESWRKKIGFIFQENFVFDASVRVNLNYGLEKEASEETLWKALERAQLADRVRALPLGIDSEIGERGVQLSGGEKQRLCMARMILSDPDIIVFDEATSALDSKTEAMIQSFLSEWTQGKTVVLIAHRLATIKNADKIICLENGEVAEEGTLNELLAVKGKFQSYWSSQNM